MEAEVNTLPISEETFHRIFFQEEARRIREAYDNNSAGTSLPHLRSQLQNIKRLLINLQLPWDRCIPILFRSFACYMRLPDTVVNGKKVYQTTSLLMDSVTNFSQSGREIQALITFFDHQIADLDRMIAERELI